MPVSARANACAVFVLVASAQAASIRTTRVPRPVLRDVQSQTGAMRLRGGGLFGMGGDKAAGNATGAGNATVVASKEGKSAWMMRSTSYSVLDEAKVKEPGLDAVPAEDESPKNATAVLAAAHIPPKPAVAASEAETAEFAEKAKKQSQQVKGGPECRVNAALEALDENAEKYEDFKRHSIVIVASEHAAYAKTGGLADVVDKLSLALALRGHRVMTIIPMYGDYEGAVPTGIHRGFGLFGQGHTVQYFHKWLPLGKDRWGNESGVDHVFVEHPCYRRPGMYGEWGQDYEDNLMRFALFSWAAIEAPLCVPAAVPFGDDVIFLANDWQTGLVPLILTSHYRRHRALSNARCIFTVHNMGYQGVYPNPPTWEVPKFSLMDFGLRDQAYYDRYLWTFPIDERPSKGRDPRDDGEAIKLLRGGIEMADRVVTVAPSYKDEMQSLEGGFGLHEAARGRSYHLDGILNGIDITEWDPSKDHRLPAHYTSDDMRNKSVCKQALQEELGLEQKPDTPLVVFIGRLAPQKGVDLIEEVFGWLLGGDSQGVTGDVQLVMMGSGEGRYVDFLMNAERHNKGRVVGYVGFSPDMEHKMLAAADILLMPSRYEPCGLPQMYAQRYGTVPVVHATGGLKDSVVQYDPFADAAVVEEEEEVKAAAATNVTGTGEGVEKKVKVVEQEGHGTGWQFGNADAEGLKFGLWNALNTYKHHKASWKKIMRRCMKTDFSWELSAKKYEQVFNWAKMDAPFQNPWPF
eukprot:Tamp_07221.p1 GENE.Tamp_07221~~Tamp_07221.p1  ORF type:complete len:746 (+),score=180.62 Tamp_07221:72-2309(+)